LNSDINLFASFLPEWIILAGALLTSFLITYISIPSIVKIAKHKKLFDLPNERTSHDNEVPVLGGLSIFAGLAISIVLFTSIAESSDIKFLLGGLIVLLFLGLKDDVLMIDPRKKLAGQVIAAAIVVILGDIRIIYFHSILGIESISYIPGVMITIFLFLTLINGFNLIDGVDGLSSGAGILSGLFFSVWFMLCGNLTYAVISLSITGALIAYFRFNVFGRRNKIFMGDTGSMITGMTIAFLAVKFLELAGDSHSKYNMTAAPAVAFGVLILPLFDILRIFLLRIFSGRSPFKADKGHVHHVLLRFGLSHLKVTSYMLTINLFFLCLALLFQQAGSLAIIFIMLILSAVIVFILQRILKARGIPSLNGH
jgi:UDP-N-acetylmuramyl pentapeptide phosphotransferase/UDP-N-acetylglucosamine-1-phosphate transferase